MSCCVETVPRRVVYNKRNHIFFNVWSFSLHQLLYDQACLTAFLPLVNFKYSAEVRSTSSQALAPIFAAACEFAIQPEAGASARSLPQHVLAPLVKAIMKQITAEDEDDLENRGALADALSEILYAAYQHKVVVGRKTWCVAMLSMNDAEEVVSSLISLLQHIFQRRSEVYGMLQGCFDEDEIADYENMLSTESQIITSFVDSIGYMLKACREAFVPIFKALVAPFFGPLLTRAGTSDVKARYAAVCLFDDCVEHCGADAASTYGQTLVPGVLDGLATEDDDLKAAAVYGAAQLARHAASNLPSPVASRLVQSLQQIVSSNVQGEESALVEGAISSLATMTLFPSSPCKSLDRIDRGAILDAFLQAMPLRNDDSEAQVRIVLFRLVVKVCLPMNIFYLNFEWHFVFVPCTVLPRRPLQYARSRRNQSYLPSSSIIANHCSDVPTSFRRR